MAHQAPILVTVTRPSSAVEPSSVNDGDPGEPRLENTGVVWHRSPPVKLLPIAGVVYAVLGIVNVGLTNIPDLGDSNAQASAFYASASHRHREVAAAYVGVAAALLFLVFVYAIHDRAGQSGLTALGLVGAGGYAALLIAAQAAFLAPTASVSLGFSSADAVDPDFARQASTLADAILFGGAALGGLAVLVLGAALLKERISGRWLGWFGIAAGAVSIALTFTFFPLLVLPLWAIVTGAALTFANRSRPT
jgi:hypothetical protein